MVAGIGVTVVGTGVTGVTGTEVGFGVGTGIVNCALHTVPAVMFVHGTLGIVNF